MVRKTISIWLVFMVGVAYCNAQVKESTLPNIVFIYADDLGYAEVGSYGQQKIRTPNIDKLAEDGIRFTQQYSSSPVCAPSRCMMLTGKHAGHAYVRSNYGKGGFTDDSELGQFPLPENAFTIGHLFQNAGYVTGAIGKWGLGMANNSGSPLKQGFDYFYGYLDQKQAHNYYPTHLWENDKWDTLPNVFFDVHEKLDPSKATDKDFERFFGKEYSVTKMAEKAVSFIERNKDNKFFLYIPFTIPHVALQAPQEFIDQYVGEFKEKPYYGQNNYAPSKYPLSTYAAMITYMDYQVGVLMEELKRLGLEENTLVIFSSDNGTTFNGGVNAAFFNSTGGLRGLKADVFEGGIRVPFIAKWPGRIKEGTVSDLPIVQYDLMATFAELTRQKVKNTDGVSFLPELLGNHSAQKGRKFIYFEFPAKGGQVAVRMGDWKAVRIGVKNTFETPWMLFNLAVDREEKQDVSALHPDLIKKAEKIFRSQHESPQLKEWEMVMP
ncbi:MAG: arylsulfatase [Chitinophagaceae bacterium]|nr:arylsulfatase [Chitinophagaceae bacterium]